MPKEYRYYCGECNGMFTTPDKDMPICRGCWQTLANKIMARVTREYVISHYGKPSPTPLQDEKWRAASNAKRLIKERQQSIINTERK